MGPLYCKHWEPRSVWSGFIDIETLVKCATYIIRGTFQDQNIGMIRGKGETSGIKALDSKSLPNNKLSLGQLWNIGLPLCHMTTLGEMRAYPSVLLKQREKFDVNTFKLCY